MDETVCIVHVLMMVLCVRQMDETVCIVHFLMMTGLCETDACNSVHCAFSDGLVCVTDGRDSGHCACSDGLVSATESDV